MRGAHAMDAAVAREEDGFDGHGLRGSERATALTRRSHWERREEASERAGRGVGSGDHLSADAGARAGVQLGWRGCLGRNGFSILLNF